MARRGLQGVTLIAVNEVWSAMRFRPSEMVRESRSMEQRERAG
jgi:hypothetical protein